MKCIKRNVQRLFHIRAMQSLSSLISELSVTLEGDVEAVDFSSGNFKFRDSSQKHWPLWLTPQ